jgi:AmmeMemoRadiSam system protein B
MKSFSFTGGLLRSPSRRELIVGSAAQVLSLGAQARAGVFLPESGELRKLVLEAIEAERHAADGAATGVTVPHHLVAARLIARGLRQVSKRQIARVVLIGPDHFGRSKTPASTTDTTFDTVFGPVECDHEAVARLLALGAIVERSDLFLKEHSTGAILPFVRRLFPNARVLPIVMALGASQSACDQVAECVAALDDDKTVVVQSTDFSHFLTEAEAAARDQETLNVIAADEAVLALDLSQPDNLDSRASQYVQMVVQKHLNSCPVVVANESSVSYGGSSDRTTTYIVQRFDSAAATEPEPNFDGDLLYFAGDVLLGRGLADPLSDGEIASRLTQRVKTMTGGRPLIVNLEGLLLAEVPANAPPGSQVMLAATALPILNAMNVQVAVLANNHCMDLGEVALQETATKLEAAGIKALRHGQMTTIAGVQLAAFNTVGGNKGSQPPVLTESDLDILGGTDSRPSLVFVHWGREYTSSMSADEWQIADMLRQRGISCVIGCHSHRAASRLECVNGGAQQVVFSLGNFLFDQRADRGSSALLELRLFKRGTYFSRLLPVPDLYEEILGWPRAAPVPQPEAIPFDPPATPKGVTA